MMNAQNGHKEFWNDFLDEEIVSRCKSHADPSSHSHIGLKRIRNSYGTLFTVSISVIPVVLRMCL